MSARSGTRAFVLALVAAAAFPAGAQEPPPKAGAESTGDPLPAGAFARLGTARMRHGLEVNDLIFAPDGLTFASASLDEGPEVRLWETATGKELRRFVPIKNPQGSALLVTPIAFSPDGKTLAGVSLEIHLWEVETGKELRRWGDLGIQIRALKYSPDGTQIAAADSSNGLRIYEASSGKERLSLKTKVLQQPYGQSIAFSPDGRRLATGGEDRSVHVWDTGSGEDLLGCPGHSGRILSIAYSPDGKTIATGSADKTVRVWDAALGQEIHRLEGHSKEVYSVHYSPDGRTIISADYDSTMRFWDAGSGALLRTLTGHGLRANRIAFSSDGKRFLRASHGKISLYDLATGKDLLPSPGHEREIQALQFSRDGRTLFTQGGDDSIRSWTVATREETSRILDHVSASGSMAPSGDGGALLVGTWNDIFLRDISAKGLGAADRWRIRAREAGSISVASAPDGKTFAWAVGQAMRKEDHTVHLAQTQTGEELRALKGHKGAVSAISFSADGKTLATASAGFRGDNSIRYWDPSTGAELRSFEAREKETDGRFVRGYVAFSPDLGVVGSSDDRSLALREGATGRELARVECGEGLGLSAAAFSPDGRFIAVAESRAEMRSPVDPERPAAERIRLLEVATGAELSAFANGQGRTVALAFSPDGRILASGGHDTTVLFWDLWGGPGKAPLPADLGRLWGDLGGADGKKAWQAGSSLAAGGDDVVAFVALHLRPARGDASRVRQWIADLSSPTVAVQLKASKMLAQALDLGGTRAEIEKVLAGKPSEELRVRLESILSGPQNPGGSRSPEELLRGRAIHLLERISSSKAKEALRVMAEGEPSGLSREARAALVRIEARSEAK